MLEEDSGNCFPGRKKIELLVMLASNLPGAVQVEGAIASSPTLYSSSDGFFSTCAREAEVLGDQTVQTLAVGEWAGAMLAEYLDAKV